MLRALKQATAMQLLLRQPRIPQPVQRLDTVVCSVRQLHRKSKRLRQVGSLISAAPKSRQTNRGRPSLNQTLPLESILQQLGRTSQAQFHRVHGAVQQRGPMKLPHQWCPRATGAFDRPLPPSKRQLRSRVLLHPVDSQRI